MLFVNMQAIQKRYPEILRNLRPLPGSLDVRDVPRAAKPSRQRRRQHQQHWLAAAAAVLPVNLPPGGVAGQQQARVKQQRGLPSGDELQVRALDGVCSCCMRGTYALVVRDCCHCCHCPPSFAATVIGS